MNEDFLQFLWQYRLFNEQELASEKGENIKILNIGTKNLMPDPIFSMPVFCIMKLNGQEISKFTTMHRIGISTNTTKTKLTTMLFYM